LSSFLCLFVLLKTRRSCPADLDSIIGRVLDELRVPIVQAPMAGGPSTPALAAAVCEAGGLGFLAAGYKTTAAVADDVAALRSLTSRPFGVNLFSPGEGEGGSDPVAVAAFVERLESEARGAGVELGAPRYSDDEYEQKLELLLDDPVAVVSFTFGCPEPGVVSRLRAGGSAVWVTVTDPEEAERAEAAGADALVVQGVEAGGHRGSFVDRADRVDYGLLALLQLVAHRVRIPLVASGGIATGEGVAAALAAGAVAAQIGTAFMLSPEAATSAPQRAAIASTAPTGLTRAFSGRLARGIVNRMQAAHSEAAPIAYPEIHYVTAPLRAHAREAGDPDRINLWAGEAHELSEERPAAEIVAELARGAREALQRAARSSGTCSS
jgi:nitronate monooxygenase